MKRLFILLLLANLFTSCVERNPQVLLYIRGDGLNSADFDYMWQKEAGVMKDILKESGFDVIAATVAGEVISTDSTTIIPDLKIDDVKIADYAGFIIPCMADTGEIAAESITLVKKFLKAGKPVAAQFGGVFILAKAGVLDGKKYANYQEPDLEKFPAFKNAFYSGQAIIQDGNIITSGKCPFMARVDETQDGTEELTRTLIKVIRGDEI